MRIRSRLPTLAFLLFAAAAPAGAQETPSDIARKQARATRVPAGAVRVDGRLDEEVWRNIPALADFVQKEPDEGRPATDRTEVRIAYDDAALYIGARMSASAPIQAPMGRRDEAEQSEHILVSLDTYLDRRTAATFGVTATGVRIDTYHASDNEWDDDATFNPVWEARTSVQADGWTAELRIPFSQLRFNERDLQVWGLNIRRWVPASNEEVFWSPVRRTDERFASLFGDLHGIDVRPRGRLEVMPYVASDAHLIGDVDPRDPFSGGANLQGRVGADLKLGLGSNLTLEATVNPDFGQVEADPAEVNLSAFETFFAEQRPFFLEGADLLSGNVNNYFYSRRIGAAPPGRADGEFVQYPSTATILGAAKLTGRLGNGTSIGVLGALTDEESARTFSGAQFGRVQVAPRTAYGVARIARDVGGQGSTIGLMATGVHRQLDAADPLAALLARNAVTLSSDSVLRFGDYEVQGYLGMSHVAGEPAALLRLQRSSAHYFQRPDVDYVRVDPTRRSMTGAKAGFSIELQQAEHWLWEVSGSVESPEFETNDLGRLNSGDGRQIGGEIEYQDTTPGRWYREYSITVGGEEEWNYGGERQISRVEAEATATLPNFWVADWTTEVALRRQDMRLTRGGPSMERPRSWRSTLEIEGSEAAQTRLTTLASYGGTEDGGLYAQAQVGLTLRPAPQWQVTVTPGYIREVETQQYVATRPGGDAATFGNRYLFGHIDRSTYSTQARLNYTFKPDLTLDFYAEPFAASGKYLRFGELAAARSRLLLPVDAAALGLADRDFNVQSFRSNLVLRWEYRPGSTLYLVWQQDRAAETLYGHRAGVGDMFDSLTAPGANFFAVKMSYWFSR